MFSISITSFGDWLLDVGLLDPTAYQHGDGWSCWGAHSFIDGTKIQRRYIYISPSCTWAELEKSRSTLVDLKLATDYGIVFPTVKAPQLHPKYRDRLAALFPNGRPFTLRTLYHSAAFNRGLRDPHPYPVENFIQQKASFPGISEPIAALTTLVRWLRGEVDTKQRVAVLLAPGGQGKTTVARQLFEHFSTARYEATIPLLVNSNSWERNVDQIDDIEDIWRHGIRECYPDAGIAPEMLQRCLFLGTICPVFDGLDELCTILPWDFKPDETLSSLITTFEGTFGDGRLLITSRLTFWEDNISPALSANVLQIHLHKFDVEERRNYLTKRFPDELGQAALDRRARAERILTRISTRTKAYDKTDLTLHDEILDNFSEGEASDPYSALEFVPFIVMLAADSADTEQSDLGATYGHLLQSSDPLRGLCLAICEREKLRQKMPSELDAERQLQLLEVLAGEFGDCISDEDVKLAFSDVGFDPEIRSKFVDHSLIGCRAGVYSFNYHFIYDYLRSSLILNWLQGAGRDTAARNVLRACAATPGNLFDSAADLIRSVCGDSWVQKAAEKFRNGSFAQPFDAKALAGFFQLLLALVKRDAQRSSRTEKLLTVCGVNGKREFYNLHLEGTIDNIDLRSVSFNAVCFGDIEFVHCDFGVDTTFVDCRFEGRVYVENCKDFGLVIRQGGTLTAQAQAAFQRFAVTGVDKRITSAQIDAALNYVLRKFRRGVGLKSCKEDGIRGSINNEYAFGDSVVDSLVKNNTLERFRHGILHLLRVQEKGDVYQFLNNNYRRGTIKAAFDALVAELVK